MKAQALKAVVSRQLSEPGAKWTPETGWTNEPIQPFAAPIARHGGRTPLADAMKADIAAWMRSVDAHLYECRALMIADFASAYRLTFRQAEQLFDLSPIQA